VKEMAVTSAVEQLEATVQDLRNIAAAKGDTGEAALYNAVLDKYMSTAS